MTTRQPQKIVFISDLHADEASYLTACGYEVTSIIEREKPAVLIYGGDFGEGSHGKEDEVIEAMQEFNSSIDPKIRRIFLRGNHDHGILQKAFPRHKTHNHFLHRRTLYIHGDDFDIFGEIPYFFAQIFDQQMTPDFYWETKKFILNLLSRDLRENDVLRPLFTKLAKAWNSNDKVRVQRYLDRLISYILKRIKGHWFKKQLSKSVLEFIGEQVLDMMQKRGRDNKAFPDPARVERFVKLHGLIGKVDTIVSGHSHEWHDRYFEAGAGETSMIRDINAGTVGFANKPRTIFIDDGETKRVVEI
jgi:UDP-2,3-diacylglucosamine pyrophosphatase LpxH